VKRRAFLTGAALGVVAAAAIPAPAYASSGLVYDPSYKTAHLYEYGNPVPAQALTPERGLTMQDFALPAGGNYFVTQGETVADGSENTLISRLDSSGRTLDFMRLIGAGHGIGLEVEYRSGVPWLYLNWHGASAYSGWRTNDYVRLSWYPNIAGRPTGWERGTCNQQFGLEVLPVQDPEMLVKVDWFRRFAVCKHYDSAGNDVFTRRRLDDMLAGVDDPLERITVPIAGATLQGFGTVNDTLYKYSGAGADGGVMSASDPIRIQSWDWNTQQPIADHTYPTLGQVNGAWRDGHAEPEGMTAYRSSDGYTQLLVGVVTGTTSGHRWQTYRFADIGI
jgi:hypothetical protein